MPDDDRPLSVTLSPYYGGLIRRFAKAQGCTYASAVHACIQAMLAFGGPVILDPFGGEGVVRTDDTTVTTISREDQP